MTKKRMAEMASILICCLKGIHADTWIASACVIPLLIISIMPVSAGRSESEMFLCIIIPAIAASGVLTVLIRKIQFRFNWIDGIVFVWYAYSMCRLWFDATYPAAGFAIRATLMCILYMAMRIVLSGCRIPGKAITFFLIIFALIEAGMGYYQIFSGVSRHHLYPATGSFLNPGPYSAYLALGIVSICALKKPDNFSYLVVMILSAPLAITLSRAAFLAILVCLLIRYHDRIKDWRQWTAVLVIIAFCGFFLYLIKAGSADGRGIINYIGLQCIADTPFRGSGIGSFFHIFAEKTAEISVMRPETDLFYVDVIDYAFNDLLLVGVEQGFLGLVFALALIGCVLHRLWILCPTLFFSVLSLLIFSLFSYPFELLPYQVIGAIITAYAASNQKTAKYHNRYSLVFAVFKATAVMTIIFRISFICYNTVKERLDAEKEYRMFAALRDKAFTKDYYALLSCLEDNKHFLFDFAKVLSEQGRYNDSNDMLRRGALISNDPMFLVLQGNNYRDMGAYELAEQIYLNAWHTIPNRIYPLYQLMKLHEQLGNTDIAKAYAEKVIEFKEKIPSPAVNDMKEEAHIIYE